MKFYAERAGQDGIMWNLEMTRHNLRTLLAKLDDPKSARTLGKTSEDLSSYILVKAVEDEEHYANRPPGEVYNPTLSELRERLVRAREELQALAEDLQGNEPESRRFFWGAQGVDLAISYLDEVLRR